MVYVRIICTTCDKYVSTANIPDNLYDEVIKDPFLPSHEGHKLEFQKIEEIGTTCSKCGTERYYSSLLDTAICQCTNDALVKSGAVEKVLKPYFEEKMEHVRSKSDSNL